VSVIVLITDAGKSQENGKVREKSGEVKSAEICSLHS